MFKVNKEVAEKIISLGAEQAAAISDSDTESMVKQASNIYAQVEHIFDRERSGVCIDNTNAST